MKWTKEQKDEIRNIVDELTRKQAQVLLERWGFAVYQGESMKILRKAVKENVLDGTIPLDDLYSIVGGQARD